MRKDPIRDDEGIPKDADGIAEDEGGYVPVTLEPTEGTPFPNSQTTVTVSSPATTYLVKSGRSRGEAAKIGESPELPQWLLRTFDFYGRKQTYTVQAYDFEREYPNLWQLVQAGINDGIIDGESGSIDPGTPGSTPNDHYIILKPSIWERLRAAVRQRPGPKSHDTQLTRNLEDGTKLVIDTRNLSGAVLSTPERAARSCLYWLDIFKDPENSGQGTKMRMNLERADALWGRELEQQNPGLYLRVMQALGHPEKAGLNPVLALDDMEGGT